MSSNGYGLRSWDIAHPRLWGVAINEHRVPWADSERITAEENLEELIMLGLRMREGLDLERIDRVIAVDRLTPMIEEGLVTVVDGRRVVPTRRGRLINDTVIERFFDLAGI